MAAIKNSFIEFRPNIKVNYIRYNKLDEKLNSAGQSTGQFDLQSLSEVSSDPLARETFSGQSVFFTTYARELNVEGQSIDTVEAYYFPPRGELANAFISIYRRNPYQKYYDCIYEFSSGDFAFYDYNVMNNQYYHYLVSALVNRGETTQERYKYYIYDNKDLTGNEIYMKMHFDSWIICDIEEVIDNSGSLQKDLYKVSGNIWKLGLNMDEENIQQNIGISKWDTLGKYPRASYGEKSYAGSQFTGLLGYIYNYSYYTETEDNTYTIYSDSKRQCGYTEKVNVSNPYSTEIEKLQDWKKFIENGSLKFIRDLKGNGWIVQIVDSYSYRINNGSNLQETSITFSWQEAADITKSSIIGVT